MLLKATGTFDILAQDMPHERLLELEQYLNSEVSSALTKALGVTIGVRFHITGDIEIDGKVLA